MTGVRCMWMRGGTSKGAFFVADELPADTAGRDDLLLRIMGSPDPRQIDGIGGGHPLTSKVAVIGRSDHPDADVDYLFLQVAVDDAEVTDRQNCGNILAGVGPFAVERGIVEPAGTSTSVRIRMVNSGGIVTATFRTDPDTGAVRYGGDSAISGVPGTASPISLAFADTAGSSCGALLPTGHVVDEVDGLAVTLIDNGMPVVLVAASDLGVSGAESPAELEADGRLAERIAQLRGEAGKLMGYDDVSALTVPKVTLVARPVNGGSILTRTFIPVRCHTSIGVLGAVTVATAALLPGSVAARVVETDSTTVRLEHPTGHFDCVVDLTETPDHAIRVDRAAVIRTARKLFDGIAFPRDTPAAEHFADDSRKEHQ